MNKKGENKNAVWIVIAVIVLGYFAVQGGWFKPAAQTTTTQTGNVPAAGTAPGGSTIITTATTLSYVTNDAFQGGLAVSATPYVGINGASLKTGITSASVGDKLEILFVNNTNYHNAYLKEVVVPSSSTATIPMTLKKSAAATMTMFNTNSQVMTNNGGAVNQTVTAGGAYNMKLRIDGQDKASTNDMRCVLEGSDGTKIDKLTLNGFGATYVGMAKPSSYTLSSVNSQVWVYDVPAIEGAVSPEGVIGVTTKTGQTIAGQFFKVACYTKENFIDSQSGKVVYDMEDSLGVLQSLTSYTFKGYFTA